MNPCYQGKEIPSKNNNRIIISNNNRNNNRRKIIRNKNNRNKNNYNNQTTSINRKKHKKEKEKKTSEGEQSDEMEVSTNLKSEKTVATVKLKNFVPNPTPRQKKKCNPSHPDKSHHNRPQHNPHHKHQHLNNPHQNNPDQNNPYFNEKPMRFLSPQLSFLFPFSGCSPVQDQSIDFPQSIPKNILKIPKPVIGRNQSRPKKKPKRNLRDDFMFCGGGRISIRPWASAESSNPSWNSKL